MRKIRYIIYCLLIVGMAHKSVAQQLGVFTNYILNGYYYNPAIAGSKKVTLANLSYKDQWAGFNEAPVSYMGSLYGSYNNKGKVGLGAMVLSERYGLIQRTGGYGTYAYHFQLSEKTR